MIQDKNIETLQTDMASLMKLPISKSVPKSKESTKNPSPYPTTSACYLTSQKSEKLSVAADKVD